VGRRGKRSKHEDMKICHRRQGEEIGCKRLGGHPQGNPKERVGLGGLPFVCALLVPGGHTTGLHPWAVRYTPYNYRHTFKAGGTRPASRQMVWTEPAEYWPCSTKQCTKSLRSQYNPPTRTRRITTACSLRARQARPTRECPLPLVWLVKHRAKWCWTPQCPPLVGHGM